MKHTKIGRLKLHLKMIGHITKLEAAKYYHIYGLKEQLNRIALSNKELTTKTIMIPQKNGQPYGEYRVVR